MNFKIYNLDVFEGLKRIEKHSVDCVITSPPYWGLRDYGVQGQIGLEEHPQKYIEKMVRVFRETKKVLKSTGSLWLNLGDTYFNGNAGGKPNGKWFQPKQKMLMPHRFAIALQDDGWILRNDVIWHKPSHMPSSVKDRLTNSFEYLFHFVLRKKYYYDLDAIRVPQKEPERIGNKESIGKSYGGTSLHSGYSQKLGGWADYWKGIREYNPAGKNPADVWVINSEPYPEAHFACFPTKLVRKPLLATCPQQICVECGKLRERIIEKGELIVPNSRKRTIGKEQRGVRDKGWNTEKGFAQDCFYENKIIGFSDCGCSKGWRSGIVLDPFVGSGTTLLEAQNQRKQGIGIELNPEYIDLIKKRLLGDATQQSLNLNKIEVI